MKTKNIARVEIKDADKGEVAAVFSTFDVIDSDKDVTPPGAFEEGAKAPISAYGHTSWSGAPPVGKGSIRQTKTEAIFDGRFFMDTKEGHDTFVAVKELAEDGLGEWSYGYDPVEFSFGEFKGQDVRFLKKLKVHEVSPVLLGAGVNTRTLVAKARGDGLQFTEEAGLVLAAVASLLDRADDVVAHRREKGKHLGAESAGLLEQIDAAVKRFDALLRTPDPEQVAEEARRQFLLFQRALAIT